jgi:hypothetical protein
MNQPVVFNLRYQPEDALRVARFVQRQSFFYRNDALMAALFMFFGIVLLILILSDDVKALNIIGATLFALLPALATGFLILLFNKRISSWFAKRRVAKFFLSSPTLNENRCVEISIEGIRTTSRLDSSFLNWSGVVKVTETLTDFLVYLGDEKFPGFFPKNAIDVHDLDQVRKYFREFLGDRAHLFSIASSDVTV